MSNFRFGLILIVLLITLSSCASIMNSERVLVTIHTNKDATVILDGLQYPKGKETVLSLRRRAYDRVITVRSDSLEKTVNIRSEYSNYFVFANLPFTPISHIADYLIGTDNLLYTYDDHIYIDMNNYINGYSEYAFRGTRKEQRLLITVPEVNVFSQSVPELTNNINAVGFLGLGLTYERQYRENKYWSTSLEIASDLPVPVPMIGQFNIDRKYGYQYCWHYDIRDNYDLNDYFSVGYGLSLNRLLTPSKYAYSDSDVKKDYESMAIGLSLAAKIRITKWFALGINYNPSFFELMSDSKFDYSHYASLKMIFRTTVF
ncbi:MAG: hypothetical protein KAH48_10600 [Chlorobi bacterium]|nr:hypothetical protein [Chlorobiota bacterium]